MDIWECRKNPWYFISNFYMTLDEHDDLNPERKPFPAHWDIMRELVYWMEYDLKRPGNNAIVVPKSRQLMVSWVVVAYLLCKCMYRPMTSCFIQSQRKEDAEYQILRAKKSYNYLAAEIRESSPLTKSTDRQPNDSLHFANGSHIIGLPAGGDVIRSKVPTILLSDEAAFQDDFDDVLKAAKACVKLHIAVSSPNPGTFQKLVEDTYGI